MRGMGRVGRQRQRIGLVHLPGHSFLDGEPFSWIWKLWLSPSDDGLRQPGQYPGQPVEVVLEKRTKTKWRAWW